MARPRPGVTPKLKRLWPPGRPTRAPGGETPAAIDQADRKVLDGRYFDALKIIRGSYAAEEALLNPPALPEAAHMEEEAA